MKENQKNTGKAGKVMGTHFADLESVCGTAPFHDSRFSPAVLASQSSEKVNVLLFNVP